MLKVAIKDKDSGYGNYVVIRSKDPNNPGKEFDGLYAHFPDGEIKVSVDQEVTRGQNLEEWQLKKNMKIQRLDQELVVELVLIQV